MKFAVKPVGRLGVFALSSALALSACAQEEAPAAEEAAVPGEIVLEGERLFPESLTSDATGNIYVGSNPGLIFRASVGSETAPVWIEPNEENGLSSVFGVLADDANGLLWACTNPPMGDAGEVAIKTFSLEDASFQGSYPFPAGGPAMCNDMSIAPNGDVFASEMLGGRIMRLPAGGEAFEEWAAHEEFASIDGIAFAEDGTLYGNAIQRNSLFRVDMDEGGNFAGVTMLETSQEMGGPDGLRLVSGNTFLQSEGNSGAITLVEIEGDVATITTLAEGIDYASSVTAYDGRAYYPEGKLTFLFDPNRQMEDPGDFRVYNVAIPADE